MSIQSRSNAKDRQTIRKCKDMLRLHEHLHGKPHSGIEIARGLPLFRDESYEIDRLRKTIAKVEERIVSRKGCAV